MKIMANDNDYHPHDCNFHPQCDGWEKFVRDYPDKEITKEIATQRGYRTHGDYYKTVIHPIIDVEVCSPSDFAAVLLAAAELFFEKLALLAPQNMTGDPEERLIALRNILRELPGAMGVIPDGKYKKDVVGEQTPLALLRLQPEICTQYLTTPWGIVWYKLCQFGDKTYLVLFANRQDYAPPKNQLLWDGQNIVCLHLDNVPQQLQTKLLLGKDQL